MKKNHYQLSRSEIEEAIFDKYVTYHYSTEELKNTNKSHKENILEKHKKDFFYMTKNYGSYVASSSNVLDVGFGYGSFTNLCYQKGVKTYTGLEVSSEQRDLVEDMFPNYEFIVQDAFAFLRESKTTYDVIFMSHVMEHFTLEEQYTLLNLIGFQDVKHNNVRVGKNIVEVGINAFALHITNLWVKALGYSPPKVYTNSILSICKK